MNGICRVSGDMIIASEGESVCVAGSGTSGCGGVGAGGSAATGVWRLYDGLPYGDACSDVEASPSGYLRFRDADGGVGGATVGSRLSSHTAGAVEDEIDRRRAEDDAGVEGAADTDGGARGADVDVDADADVDAGVGTGRVHLTSQGGGGGM